MSGVNAHAIFSVPQPKAWGVRAQLPAYARQQFWPVAAARHLLGAARSGGRGKLAFSCDLRSSSLSYLWDHVVSHDSVTEVAQCSEPDQTAPEQSNCVADCV